MDRIWSFDVFDTLLGRIVDDPQQVFVRAAANVAQTHGLPLSPQAYASERVAAEKRLLAKGRFPPLPEIAKELVEGAQIDAELVEVLLAEELRLEQAELWPIARNVQLLRQKRAEGGRVIYISNMYLSSVFIGDILARHGISGPGEPVFVSCEHGVGKKTGALFTHVADKLGVKCSNVVHFGDNHRADLLGARKAGAQGHLLTHGHLNKYEAEIHSFVRRNPVQPATRTHFSLVGGVLRRARLEHDGDLSPKFTVAVGVAAPVLFWFVQAALRWATENDIGRLYFLARDGDILLEIAKMICAGRPDAPVLRYLHVSRLAALLGTLQPAADAEQLRSIVKSLRPCSLQEFAHHVSPTNDALLESYRREDLAESISELPMNRIIQPLLEDPKLYGAVLRQNEGRRHLFSRYLAQEGLLTNAEKVALIDVGWQLTIHDLIASAVLASGGSAPAGYYFGIDDVRTDSRLGVKEAFMWDARGGERWTRIEYITRIIEVFCTSDQRRTVDYALMGGEVRPRFSPEERHIYDSWGLAEVRTAILDACRHLNTLNPSPEPGCWERLLARELLARFWNQPSVQEVEAWGSFPFGVTQSSRGGTIPLYVPSNLLVRLLFAARHGSMRGSSQNSWPGATRRMTNPAVQWLTRMLVSLRNSVKGLAGR